MIALMWLSCLIWGGSLGYIWWTLLVPSQLPIAVIASRRRCAVWATLLASSTVLICVGVLIMKGGAS